MGQNNQHKRAANFGAQEFSCGPITQLKNQKRCVGSVGCITTPVQQEKTRVINKVNEEFSVRELVDFGAPVQFSQELQIPCWHECFHGAHHTCNSTFPQQHNHLTEYSQQLHCVVMMVQAHLHSTLASHCFTRFVTLRKCLSILLQSSSCTISKSNWSMILQFLQPSSLFEIVHWSKKTEGRIACQNPEQYGDKNTWYTHTHPCSHTQSYCSLSTIMMKTEKTN